MWLAAVAMPLDPISHADYHTILSLQCVNLSQLDPMAQEATKRQMMLERFQEENPGFDFSGAEFNGSAPDPRTFMGGVKYS